MINDNTNILSFTPIFFAAGGDCDLPVQNLLSQFAEVVD